MSVSGKATRRLQEVFSLVKAVLLGRPNVSLENRRQAQRLRLRVPILCKLDEEEFEGELVDLSSTGMRAMLPHPVEVDDTLRISATEKTGLVGRQRLVCRVAWVKFRRPEFEVGLEYNDSDENVAHSWIQLALRHLDPDQVQRRARRIQANLRVQVSQPNGGKLGRGVCVNLSTGGCLLQMDRLVPKDEVVRIGLGTNEQETNIFLTGRIVSHVYGNVAGVDPRNGHFLHHMQFFPGENRNHSRLRSLLLTLLESLGQQADLEDEPEVDVEEFSSGPSLFERLSQPLSKPMLTPAAVEPVVLPATAPRPPEAARPLPPPPSVPKPPSGEFSLKELIGEAGGPVNPRSVSLRSTSLWAARNLPVGLRTRRPQRDLPKDEAGLAPESDNPTPGQGDFRD